VARLRQELSCLNSQRHLSADASSADFPPPGWAEPRDPDLHSEKETAKNGRRQRSAASEQYWADRKALTPFYIIICFCALLARSSTPQKIGMGHEGRFLAVSLRSERKCLIFSVHHPTALRHGFSKPKFSSISA